jgi:DNA adenine methylase
VIPFLKWAGGKRWLVSSYPELFPKSFNRYIEPFLGSGAVFFHIQPRKALLADSNAELIETYQAIKSDWRRVERELKKHHELHCKSYYYKIRDNKYRSPFSRAAKLIYLNRTCWNGLYRVNLKGEFNVPIGTKKDVIYAADDFKKISQLLQNVRLLHGDFEQIIDQATKGDFVFVDPPYTVQHNSNNFIKYNENLFHWQDQIRLRDCVYRAKGRGAQVIVTNACHKSVKRLYEDIGVLVRVKRHSVLAADASKRKICDELLIVV